MQFVFPGFLWALAVLAVPVIIHLFYFRRFKKVYFTNVALLKEVKEESSARSKLRNFLVLLARCLALSALVLAFAQPFLPKNDARIKRGEKAVSIFVDNSFSMNAQSKDVSLLEKAKMRAREIVAAYAADDRFQILTNDFDGRSQRLVNKDDALNLIEAIKTGPAVQTLSKVLTLQRQTLSQSKTVNKTVFLISDFQKNIVDLKRFQDSVLEINLVPLQAVQEKNIAIDSVWFETPVQIVNQTNPLVARIHNYSKEDVENVKLTLHYDGQDKPVGMISLKANATVTDTIPLTAAKTGWYTAELEITDYPIQFDDHYYFTFNVPARLNVLTIYDGAPNRFLDAALQSVKSFKVDNQPNSGLQYSVFPNYQLIVLNGLFNISSGLAAELAQYVKNGGSVLVFPPFGADLNAYNGFFNAAQANAFGPFETVAREVSGINTDEFIFKDVFTNKNANLKLPTTQGNYRLANRTGEILLTYRDGGPFLTKNKSGKGNLYICAAPLDEKYSALSRNGEIFIPLLYKAAISSGKDWKIAYTIGKDDYVEVDPKNRAGEKEFRMKGKKEEFIPDQRITNNKAVLNVKGAIKDAGFYQAFIRPDSVLYQFGFNFDRRESDLDYYDAKALSGFTRANIHLFDAAAEANFTALVGEQNQGTPLWRWCVWLALAFLAIEVLLLRFWK